MSYFQRFKNAVTAAANTALPYVLNFSYIVGGLLFAPNVRQMFDTAVDYYSNYSINPNTPAYTLARETVGYLGTPILLKAGAVIAQKVGEAVVNKASDLINDYRARANERAQAQAENEEQRGFQQRPEYEEDPKFAQHPDYQLIKRFRNIIASNPQLQEIVTDQSTHQPDIKKITKLFYSFKHGDMMDRLERMNHPTQAAACKAFAQRM